MEEFTAQWLDAAIDLLERVAVHAPGAYPGSVVVEKDDLDRAIALVTQARESLA